jgi:hypothetical protein
MGLFHSVLSLCPCSTPRKVAISPEVISHPYPLAPKSKSRTTRPTAESRFRPHPINPYNANWQGPYRQLESPSYPHSHSHSKTVSDSTTSTTPQLGKPRPLSSDGRAIDGLGLGLGNLNLRPPDRAYVLAERNLTVGYGTGRSSRGRKLQKTRLVEGDWELVRTGYDHLGIQKDGQGSKRISRMGIEGEKQETSARTVVDTDTGV